MNQELKTKWLDALRSGNYEQGQDGYLRDTDDQYCCLGVLYEVSGHTWEEFDYEYSTDQGSTVGIVDYQEEFGISEADEGYLVEMNDVDSMSFEEIAEWIEANL